MGEDRAILPAKGGFFRQTWQSHGIRGCLRKLAAALQMYAAPWLLKRRTNKSVGAYFDLITDDARLFYDDNFHFGFFHTGATTLAAGVAAHTDLVAEMAELQGAARVLDVGCGIGAPALRIAERFAGHITGVNISREQVRQGRGLIDRHGLTHRIDIQHGNALALEFPAQHFDAALCIEVAGDICVAEDQKRTLVREMFRVLKPGGHIGFSDLIFTARPTPAEERIMRAILYHEGAELITDWPAQFREAGFAVKQCRNMIEQTAATWRHSLAIYQERTAEVEQRYGRKIAQQTMAALREIPHIMEKYGAFVVLSAQKPAAESAGNR